MYTHTYYNAFVPIYILYTIYIKFYEKKHFEFQNIYQEVDLGVGRFWTGPTHNLQWV